VGNPDWPRFGKDGSTRIAFTKEAKPKGTDIGRLRRENWKKPEKLK